MAVSMNWVFTNTARYQNTFGDHSLTALAGYEALKYPAYNRSLAASGLNPFTNDPNYISISNTPNAGRTSGSGSANPRSLASVFGRVDYNYRGKYYASVTLRRDASSVFGQTKKAGVFPAFSAAWRLSDEDFMQGISWLSDLKIRGGWGIMGNQNISPTNQYTLYQGGPINGYDISGTNNAVSSGLIPQQVGNPYGAWEKNITSNVGIDATVLDGTMDIILDVWQKNTSGLLYNPPLPATAGVYVNNPFINIASMVNKGIDLQIIKHIKVNSDWEITLDGNISPFKNKITQLAPGVPYFNSGTYRNVTFIRNAVDQPLSSFYGYKVEGYFKDQQDVDSSPTQDGAGPGRFKFADTDGDGKITPDDRVFMGSPVPKFTYGFNLTASYKNWTLTAFFYGKQGNKIVNFSKWYNNFYQSFSGAALSTNVLNAWTPDNTDHASTPVLETTSNFSTNTQANSWYVENGSYLRARNIQLAYNIPESLLSRWNLGTLTVYGQVNNLFTITKYTGKDPEVASQVDTTLGVDIGNYPATRVWTLGLNLGF